MAAVLPKFLSEIYLQYASENAWKILPDVLKKYIQEFV